MGEIHRGKGGNRFFGRAKMPSMRGVMGSGFIQLYPAIRSSTIWTISGITKDSTGTPLANCFVSLEFADSSQRIATTTSDGSGNFSFEVDGGKYYQLNAYKTGAPDLAGITVNTVLGV